MNHALLMYRRNVCRTIRQLMRSAWRKQKNILGQWVVGAKKALEVSGQNLFWAILQAMNTTRAPLIHFSNWLKKKHTHDEPGKVSQMVNGRCQATMMEFWNLLFTAWENDFVENLSISEAVWVQYITFRVICKNASQFYRRRMKHTTELPLKLFGLIKNHTDTKCETRKQIAQEILHLGETGVSDMITRKLLANKLFYRTFVEASETGILGSELYTLLYLCAKYIKVDVRENERINKLLSMLGESCPNANLANGFAVCSNIFAFCFQF